jgi:pyrroline-5-carboxylate reductase
MARSLIAGLIADGHEPSTLTVSDPLPERRVAPRRAASASTRPDNAAADRAAEVVVLCVKPQAAPSVCRELARAAGPAPLVISIMAGVTEASIAHWLGADPLVRAMPNTPMMVQSGAIGLHANAATTPLQRNLAEEIMRAGGLTRWVDNETELDAVTAVSGSGPAYFFLFMEALEKAAIEQGLDAEAARLLSIQTALGAARMAWRATNPRGSCASASPPPAAPPRQALRPSRRAALTPGQPRRRRRPARAEELSNCWEPTMTEAYFTNPLIFLVKTLFGLYITIVVIRFLLQWARADFYNPISQFVVKLTSPVLRPLRKVIPGYGGLDLSALVLAWLLKADGARAAVPADWARPQPAGRPRLGNSGAVGPFISIFLFAILIRVILSWVNPDPYNPAVAC